VEQLTLDGGAGNDAYQIAVLSTKTTISDNKGLDSLYFSGSAAAGVTIDLSKSASQAQRVFAAGANRLGLKGTLENVIGTPQADWIKGNALANRIEGGDGNDTLYGGPGNDTLYGGPGNDWLYGEAGKDTLFGESGNNVLVGGAGNDTLNVLASADAAGRNLLIGGLGIDALQGGPGEEILVGGTTKYDNKVAALAAIMQEWALPATTFAERRQHLDAGFMEDNAGWIQLKVKNRENPRGSVLDDRTTDLLLGGLGSNWLLVFSKDETPTP
jgi:Ca2+-binding RTX toxin-like protein